MNDIFFSLTQGADFDRKRFRKDIEVFHHNTFKKSASDDTVVPNFLENTKKKNVDSEVFDKAIKKPKVGDTSSNTDIEVGAYKKQNHIKTKGSDIPDPVQNFDSLCNLGVSNTSISKILEAGYVKPSPIQAQAIPILLSGRDLLAMAPTGSGKTLAYGIPVINQLLTNEQDLNGIRALIIAPTRELAAQICREMKRIACKKLKIHHLSKINYQNIGDINGILVTTPMRLVQAIKDKKVKLDNVKVVIVDEADKLLDLGFIEQVDEIVSACSENKLQKAFFSATMPSHLENLASSVMMDPIRVIIGKLNSATETIQQELLFVGNDEGKLVAIRQMIREGIKPPVLIFVDSVIAAKKLFKELLLEGINTDVISSERSQGEREEVIQNFRKGEIWVLIATDLLGRGIDFKGVNLVINYDFPKDSASYIHRIGRTGRAGREGRAVTYFTRNDSVNLRAIANVMRSSGCEVPEWMLNLPKEKDTRGKKKKPLVLKV